MKLEEYRKLYDEMTRAQRTLNHVILNDLQRIASAESNSTKTKINQAYERGIMNMYKAYRDWVRMDISEEIEAYGKKIAFAKLEECGIDPVKFVEKTQLFQMLKDKQEKELSAGDVIELRNGVLGVVTTIHGEMVDFMNEHGTVGMVEIDSIKKTGESCPGITIILNALRAEHGSSE